MHYSSSSSRVRMHVRLLHLPEQLPAATDSSSSSI
jgi:hypothetical protein